MKKILVAMSALCLFAAFGTNAVAGEKTMKAGVDGAFVLPMGDWGDAYGMNIGALGVFEYGLDAKMVVTGRVGYLYGLEKDNGGVKASMNIIPIYAGIKYFVMKDVYVAGEAGLSMMSMKAEVMGFEVTNDETKLGITAGAGYQMGDLDLRGQLIFPSIGDLGDFMGIMATVGYRFGL